MEAGDGHTSPKSTYQTDFRHSRQNPGSAPGAAVVRAEYRLCAMDVTKEDGGGEDVRASASKCRVIRCVGVCCATCDRSVNVYPKKIGF